MTRVTPTALAKIRLVHLTDDTEIAYKIAGAYSAAHAKGLAWDDPARHLAGNAGAGDPGRPSSTVRFSGG